MAALSPGEPVPQVGAVGPLHPRVVQGPQQPAAAEHQPRAGQHHPLLRATERVQGGGALASLVQVQHVMARTLIWPTWGRTSELFRPVAAVPWEAVSADVVTQGQTQGVDEEVPGLVLLLDEAAGAQTCGVAQRPQQDEEIYLRPPGATVSWTL